ncbi:MAG: carbohydrate-binding domain-containing protein [Rhodopila sp.]
MLAPGPGYLASTWQTPVPVVPAATIVGSGANRLKFMMSEDAYLGDTQFTLKVDGTQIGGTQTVKALHAIMQSQEFDFLGTFAPGTHSIAISFINDRYAGTATLDRNLYGDSGSIDGKAITGSTFAQLANGTHTTTFQLP